jgi:hypothetical protein
MALLCAGIAGLCGIGGAAEPVADGRVPAAAQPAAEDPAFAVALSASSDHVEVGDPLTVTVTYRWPAGWRVVTPDGEPDPARDFLDTFVTNLPPPQRHSSGQEERRVFTITLAAQRSGAWELPRPTLTVMTPEGSRSSVASPVIVQVGTEARPPALPAARPAWTAAQAPEAAAGAWWWLAIPAVLAAGAVALGLLRRHQRVAVQTPWQRFADDWQAAAAAADGKEAGARLSLALRRCLGTVYRFDGPGSTTREAASHLRGKLGDDEHRELVRLLDQLDGLRWAADDLPPSAVRPLLDHGRAWTTAVERRLVAAELAAKASAR